MEIWVTCGLTVSDSKKEVTLRNWLEWVQVPSLKRLFVGSEDATRMAEVSTAYAETPRLVMAGGDVLKGLDQQKKVG